MDVALAVAQTLENAHKLEASIGGKEIQGIVHGDIKPKNIRIDAHGQVRVLDFGIAKALSLSRKLTRNEFGSVPYASPERLETGEVNAGSDLWSLAVMLYEMVTGLQPYQADSTERHGAHDPLGHRPAARAGSLSRGAAAHSDEGHGARSGRALSIGRAISAWIWRHSAPAGGQSRCRRIWRPLAGPSGDTTSRKKRAALRPKKRGALPTIPTRPASPQP